MKAAEFPIGWATFDASLRKPDGFVHIVIVDDYTNYCLWDELLVALPEIGSRPRGESWEKSHPGLPEGNWGFLHAMHTMATDALYAGAGLTKPSFEDLPAVYAIQHGKRIGKYVWGARGRVGIEFIKNVLASL